VLIAHKTRRCRRRHQRAWHVWKSKWLGMGGIYGYVAGGTGRATIIFVMLYAGHEGNV
jgi:hypothetical protein